jgi:hypothetical protein
MNFWFQNVVMQILKSLAYVQDSKNMYQDFELLYTTIFVIHNFVLVKSGSPLVCFTFYINIVQCFDLT